MHNPLSPICPVPLLYFTSFFPIIALLPPSAPHSSFSSIQSQNPLFKPHFSTKTRHHVQNHLRPLQNLLLPQLGATVLRRALRQPQRLQPNLPPHRRRHRLRVLRAMPESPPSHSAAPVLSNQGARGKTQAGIFPFLDPRHRYGSRT